MEKILLDFTGCNYISQIHKILKEGFDLPDYYGENWDALWDCLDYYCKYPLLVQIKGLSTLAKEFDEEIKDMLEIFHDVTKDTPNVQFEVVS